MNGSRNTSIAPPDRHGFCTVTEPVVVSDLVTDVFAFDSARAVRQDPQQQRLAALDRLERVEANAVLRAHAADESLHAPVLVDERDVARLGARRMLDPDHGGGDEHHPLFGELLGPASEGAGDHCGGSGRPCIAAHTRAGVHGMSMWSTPWLSCRASMIALTIAGGEPTFGDSPTPLAPSG